MRRQLLEVCCDDIGALIEPQCAFEHVRGIVLAAPLSVGSQRDGACFSLSRRRWVPSTRRVSRG